MGIPGRSKARWWIIGGILTIHWVYCEFTIDLFSTNIDSMTPHEQELLNLHDFFKEAKFPDVPFKLNKYIIITSHPSLMIEMQIKAIERYKGSDLVRDSLFKHLRELKALVENNTPINAE